ncbi:MAG: response regulator transcription factor [Bacteroidetes bacterium]|nr:response regulator transcription factor [Bacteroidota bacterium]
MEKSIGFLIVEDELMIAEMISGILINAGYSKIRIAETLDEAIEMINQVVPDIVLTDINFGKLNTGIDLGKLLFTKYKVPFIYITSYSGSEVVEKAKHTRPSAYLIKPFKEEDLLVAIELAIFNSKNSVNNQQPGEIMIKIGRSLVRLNYNDIKWLESAANYTTLHLVNNKKIIRMPLSELIEQLPSGQFIRIHKSYVVNKQHVSETSVNSIMIGDFVLPIGRTYKDNVLIFFKNFFS